MNKSVACYRWFSGRRSVVRPPDDPADMGTAFGLEMSLLEEADDTVPVAPPVRREGWIARLADRRKPRA